MRRVTRGTFLSYYTNYSILLYINQLLIEYNYISLSQIIVPQFCRVFGGHFAVLTCKVISPGEPLYRNDPLQDSVYRHSEFLIQGQLTEKSKEGIGKRLVTTALYAGVMATLLICWNSKSSRTTRDQLILPQSNPLIASGCDLVAAQVARHICLNLRQLLSEEIYLH